MHQLGQIEIAITRAQSLQTKFSQEAKSVPAQELQKFVAALLEQPEVEIAGATRVPIGSVVAKLFTSAHQVSEAFILANLNLINKVYSVLLLYLSRRNDDVI